MTPTKAMPAMLAAGLLLMHAPLHAMQDGGGGGGAEYSVPNDNDGGATTDGLLDVGWVRAFERWLDRINFGIGVSPRGGPAALRRSPQWSGRSVQGDGNFGTEGSFVPQANSE